jgi:tetratricopeptide (TPR) repeat protein
MPSDDRRMLTYGLERFKAGFIDDARYQITYYVRTNPDDDEGWLALHDVLDDPAQKEDCLRHALGINPLNAEAKRLFNEIQGRKANASRINVSSVSIQENPTGTVDTPGVPPSPPDARIPTGQKDHRGVAAVLIGLAMVTALALLAGFIFSSNNALAIFDSKKNQTETMTIIPIMDASLAPKWTSTSTVTVTSIPTIAPTKTLTSTRTITPTYPTPTKSPTPDYKTRLKNIEPDVQQGIQLLYQGKCTESQAIWEKVVEEVPEYPDGYFWKALCESRLGESDATESGPMDWYARALKDIRRAIELDPTDGEKYDLRSTIYWDMAYISSARVDQDNYYHLSEADLRKTIQNPITKWKYPSRDPEGDLGFVLLYLDRYAEALPLFNKVLGKKDEDQNDIPDEQIGLALSYDGLGQPEQAKQYIDLALADNPHSFAAGGPGEYYHSIILYDSQQYPDALTSIEKLIASNFYGWTTHYFRALIHYRLGKSYLAKNDISIGDSQTWRRGSIRSYVLGLIARDEGDAIKAKDYLLEADATVGPAFDVVVRKEIRRDLNSMQ